MKDRCWVVTVREYVQVVRVKAFMAQTADGARALAEEDDWRDWPEGKTEITEAAVEAVEELKVTHEQTNAEITNIEKREGTSKEEAS
jgi:N-dimethylarginine dimethylaminohydrolase